MSKAQQTRAINRILKRAEKSNRWKDDVRYNFIDNGKQYITDGITVLSLSDINDSVVTGKPIDDMRLKLEKYIVAGKTNCKTEYKTPDINKLKEYIKRKKELNKALKRGDIATYVFEDGGDILNSEYLKDVLEIIPNCKIYGGDKTLVYMTDGKGNEAVICKIKSDKSYKKTVL